MALLELDGLWKRYGGTPAVRGIDLRVEDGEFVALLGPSGCGKTSTMRMVAGLEDVSDGEIRFDGQVVNRVRPRDRKVAMAFENYALYSTLTVYENLAFPLRARSAPAAEIDARVTELAARMRLGDLLGRRTHELSSGQQQAVGLARALIRKPSVLLLDEPISHLDTQQRAEMRAYLKKLHLELGYTMLYVTHDQEEAMAMADRIAVMRDGELLQVGTPEAIFEHPADVFVAGFIGEPPMNLLEVELDAASGALRRGDRALPLPDRYRASARGALVLGVRPHHVRVGPRTPQALAGEIFVIEALGDATVVTASIDGDRLVALAPPGFAGAPGDAVGITLDPEHVLLFARDDGKALPAA